MWFYTVLDIWTEILHHRWELDVIYCDLMKVIDKVPHKRPLIKIKSYGICGNSLAFYWQSKVMASVAIY